jgi:hypothetical protein
MAAVLSGPTGRRYGIPFPPTRLIVSADAFAIVLNLSSLWAAPAAGSHALCDFTVGILPSARCELAGFLFQDGHSGDCPWVLFP